jgi:hypothetical protein
MKHLKKFEIGDASISPYTIDKIELDEYGYNYYFNTDSGLRYIITFQFVIEEALLYDDVLKIDFIDEPENFYTDTILIGFLTFTGPDEEAWENYDDEIITNRGELYKIMSTVKFAILDYMSKHDKKYLIFGGTVSKKDNSKEQRESLYIQYIKKSNIGWKMDRIYFDWFNDFYYIFKIK